MIIWIYIYIYIYMSCIQVIFTVILNNVILFNNLLWNSYFENPTIEFSIHTHTHTHTYIYICTFSFKRFDGTFKVSLTPYLRSLLIYKSSAWLSYGDLILCRLCSLNDISTWLCDDLNFILKWCLLCSSNGLNVKRFILNQLNSKLYIYIYIYMI